MKKNKPAKGGQTDAEIATLAQQAMKPPVLPDPENASITDRIRMNQEEAKKRLGRMSTLTVGATEKPKTVKTIAGGTY